MKDYLTDLVEFTSSIDDDKLCIVIKTAAMVCCESINIFVLGLKPACCDREEEEGNDKDVVGKEKKPRH